MYEHFRNDFQCAAADHGVPQETIVDMLGLLEEIADVKLCLHVGGFEKVRDKIQVNRIISAKAERWLKQLMGEAV